MDRIETTLAYLNQKFDDSDFFKANADQKKYRYEHTLRVANIGKGIAIKEGFNEEAMIIACLLHDISYCNEFSSYEDWLNHGRDASRMVKEFITSLGFNEETKNDILYGIAIHVDDKADFEGLKTPFAACIGDADNIDRFDAYRIYETLKNDKFDQLSFEKQDEMCTKRINKLQEYMKLEFATKTSTEMMREKIEFQLQFYRRLKNQLDNSKSISE